MEAELRTKYPDANVELFEGSGGIFDVTCNGKLIYSKQRIDIQRFPDVGEISGLIKKEMG